MNNIEKINIIKKVNGIIFINNTPGSGLFTDLSKIEDSTIIITNQVSHIPELLKYLKQTKSTVIFDDFTKSRLDIQNKIFEEYFDGCLSDKKIVLVGDIECLSSLDSALTNKFIIL